LPNHLGSGVVAVGYKPL